MEITLRPYQEQAIKFIAQKKGNAIIKIPCGGGKTIMALYLLKKYPKLGKALFITPSSVKHQFAKEYEKVFPEHKIVVLSGKYDPTRIQEIKEANTCFINYDILFIKNEKNISWSDFFKEAKFRVLVCDESQKIKNTEAKRTQAVLALSRVIPFKILMSATPITNNVTDLYSQIKTVDPLFQMSYYSFETKFCPKVKRTFRIKKKTATGYTYKEKDVWVPGNPTNLDQLNLLTERYMFSVSEKEVYAHLSEYTHIPVEADIDQSSEVRKLQQKFIDSASLIEAQSNLMSLRKAVGLSKIQFCKEWINDWLDGNKSKIVAFCYHRDVVDILQKELPGSVKFYGGMSDSAKAEAVNKFKNDPNCRVIVCNMDTVTGLDGLNTVSNTCVYCEETSSATSAEQSRGRTRRINSSYDKYFVYHIIGNLIDEVMLSAQDAKAVAALMATEGKTISEKDTLEYMIKKMKEHNYEEILV